MAEPNNPHELAGASQPSSVPLAPIEPREVFPITFEKDHLDFRPVPTTEDIAPKASSAPVSVATQTSVTGLEDVSSEDLETSAPQGAEKVTLSSSESSSPSSPAPTPTPPGSPAPTV